MNYKTLQNVFLYLEDSIQARVGISGERQSLDWQFKAGTSDDRWHEVEKTE